MMTHCLLRQKNTWHSLGDQTQSVMMSALRELRRYRARADIKASAKLAESEPATKG